MKNHGYNKSQANHTLFIRHIGNGKKVILIVYVDDIIKKLLSKEFEVKDLGMLRYFLGMGIARSKQRISVSQRKYTLDLLEETGCWIAKLAVRRWNLRTSIGYCKGNQLTQQCINSWWEC
ncbi:hypothetical protein LIER_39025 [Lithospermum erythrorhizon]|uniref:Reverse transcriptase Ty1/copia-type domain-containing protein n=1 Tax=Lithospermum erythrorhizon TaxID=34254 RepID=A0AAV3Q983_LITER